MSTRKLTLPSTEPFSAQLDRLRQALADSDAVVVGAGAGLSAAAGLTYDGPRFQTQFADFIARYHYADMYSAGFYPYPSPEEHWAYWSRHIWVNRYAPIPGVAYADLLSLVGERDYFVLTTNVDHCFQRSGFDKERLFYTQGDYGLWQCSKPCRPVTHDNEEAVRAMLDAQAGMAVPSALVPRCPFCGAPMAMNLRCDDHFVEDAGWHAAAGRYTGFLRRLDGRKVLFLELGVGGNTPVIIKYPFWKMTAANPNAFYACVNLEPAPPPAAIAARSITIPADIASVLRNLR